MKEIQKGSNSFNVSFAFINISLYYLKRFSGVFWFIEIFMPHGSS